MPTVFVICGVLLLGVVLLDAFQSIILPRRPVGRFRITRLFFLATWRPWRAVTSRLGPRSLRDHLYSIYGPLSLLILFFVWALLLTLGFALIFFGLHVAFHDETQSTPMHWPHFRSCLYVSGTTLFTLGMGDVTPVTGLARLLTVLEAGIGLAFIALVIGYVPLLYSTFSQREVLVALLDARAGSPPTAAELLLRHSFDEGPLVLRQLLADWERWCAEVLETHISYPILCYYRSQHDNQSWLAALVAVLDTCALLITMMDGERTRQAQLTFAIGRHTLVDLVHVLHLEALEANLRHAPLTRLQDQELGQLCAALEGTGFSPCDDFESRERLCALRKLYEPYACALADNLRLTMPSWVAPPAAARQNDAWTVVAGLRSPQILARKLTTHVSSRATAVNLESHDDDPELE